MRILPFQPLGALCAVSLGGAFLGGVFLGTVPIGAMSIGGAAILLLGCGGDDPAPSGQAGSGGQGGPIEPADLLAEEVLHARWDCACQATQGEGEEPATEPVAASSPCVASIVPGARRACEQEILEENWDEVRSIGTCRYNGYRAFTACLQDDETACQLEDCYFGLSDDLDRCLEFSAEIGTELQACN